MKFQIWSAALLATSLVACGSNEPASEVGNEMAIPVENGLAADVDLGGADNQSAVATLQTAEGAPAGSVTATAEDGAILLAISVQGLPPGEHGVHVHMMGQCEGPAFESAGGHWNPTNAQHGLENPQGPHAGDMPNLTVDAGGSGMLEHRLQGATFDGLLDADGSAFVIHAAADDQRTDPSGNSGDRIACGVFNAG